MKELQGQVERLQLENDQLRAHIEKSHDLGKDARDEGRDAQSITRDKGKVPVAPGDVNTLADDELSLGNSPSLNLSPRKNTRESQGLDRARGLHLTLPSVTLLVVHLAGQGERHAKDSNYQVKPLGTHQCCPHPMARLTPMTICSIIIRR